MSDITLKSITFPQLNKRYTLPQTDATLSVSGSPADAKATGDAMTALTARVSAIEEAEGLHRYGVSGIGQSASQLTRLWDAVGMTAQVGTDGDNSGVINDFDSVTPFNRRKCVGTWHKNGNDKPVFHVHAYYGDEDYKEDGTMGDYVAVECPRAYYYMQDGVLGISAHQYQGWRPFDIFCHDHNPEDTMPFYYMPAYALCLNDDGQAVCLPGYDNAQGNYKQLVDAARTYQGGALGNDVFLMQVAMNFYELAMFTVEFAQQNSQLIMRGACDLRHNADDRVTFLDSTHALTNNYYAARVADEYIWIGATTTDINNASYLATHKILSVTRCDASGNADASGTHQLLGLEDLGRDYVQYDYTGATEYRIGVRPFRTGSCNGVSTPSGSPVHNTNGLRPFKYRWRENPFANQNHTLMDLFNQRIDDGNDEYSLDWYYLPDPSAYEPSTTSKPDATDFATDTFELLDVRTDAENYVNGYIKSKKYSGEYPDVWIPHETTVASASTYFADSASLVNSSVFRACRSGGTLATGSFDGFSYLNAIYAPSHGRAYYGGDLCINQ